MTTRRSRIRSAVLVLALLGGAAAIACSPATGSRSVPPATSRHSACPDVDAGESARDCPWAAVARDMIAAAGAGADVGTVLRAEAPLVAKEVAADRSSGDLLELWGRAIDYQQAAPDTFGASPVVDYVIVDALDEAMGVAPRTGKTTHAGVQHTYGYLFSLLQTPYGYKRARWVAPDVTDGFGMPAGTFGPVPPDGTLFGNTTYLAGSIAFTGEPELSVVQGNTPHVAKAVLKLDLSKLNVTRLTEVTTLSDGRTITLRSDFVRFPTVGIADAGPRANTCWLVYSVHDTSDGRSRLITAFPISTSSFQTYTAPTLLGSNKSITTNYNAWVDGLSDTLSTGTRTLAPLTRVGQP